MRLTAKFFQHLVVVGDSFVGHLFQLQEGDCRESRWTAGQVRATTYATTRWRPLVVE